MPIRVERIFKMFRSSLFWFRMINMVQPLKKLTNPEELVKDEYKGT